MKTPILIPGIFNHPFTYLSQKKKIRPGQYVKVSFGKKEITGIVWTELEHTKKNVNLKKIIRELKVPGISSQMIKFIFWFSKYNMVPIGMVLKLVISDAFINEKKFNQEYERFNIYKKNNKIRLNIEQARSLKKLKNFGKIFNVSVLEGVTGSGKTLVYFERIREIVNKGFQGLILLPEIALTDQFKNRFINFFGSEPAIWHSKISKKNKKIIWRGIVDNKIKIVIGARSSLFLPFRKLGIIIVDEEHDASYKQDEGINYNARDMAITRASIENIPVHLVTSIPSIETYNNIISKKYNHTKLNKRFKNTPLPKFQLVDLSKNKTEKNKWIANTTIDIAKEYLKKGEQVLFFLNRRGYSPFITCRNCLIKFVCPNCSINLNFHKNINKALCHYCGYSCLINRKCKNDDFCDLLMCGPGVERIFQELKIIFPDKKIEIFSSDTLKNQKITSEFISNVENKKIDILVGTQLISKGFHFSKLNCIIVVDADFTSHGYDLRTSEKNVQLYQQLKGRAGRESQNSSLVFQTHTPEDSTLANISVNSTDTFLSKEIILRKEKKLPPFCRLIALIISSKNQNENYKYALKIKNDISKLKNLEVLGPVNAPVYKIREKFRTRLLLRTSKNNLIQSRLKIILDNINIPTKIKLAVDVDPINFY